MGNIKMYYQWGLNLNNCANPLQNWGISMQSQQVYNPVYQKPVFVPFPNFPVSQIVNLNQLPVWNYSPEPLNMALYQNSVSDFNNLYNIDFSPKNNYGTVAPQPTIPLEDWAKSLNIRYGTKNSTSSATVSEDLVQQKHSKQVENQIAQNLKKKQKEQVEIPSYNGARTTRTLSVEFLDRVKEIAKKVKCDYRDLLGVMNSESGLNPKARNKHSGAIGLIQFTGIAIKDLNQAYGMNLTKEKIANMSAMEQLDLVEKYLTRSKSFKFDSSEKLDSADLYAIVYRPAFAGKKVIATKADGKTYSLNRGLDLDKDGVISDKDLAQVVRNKHINVNLVA